MRTAFIVGLLAWGLMGGTTLAADPADSGIHQDFHQLRKDYQKKVDHDLKAIGAKIRHLKHRAQKAGDRLKADLNKEVAKLEAKKAETDRKFAELRKSSGEAWKDLRRGVDDAVADLKKAADEASERFQEKK
jgi:hypothetical protein